MIVMVNKETNFCKERYEIGKVRNMVVCFVLINVIINSIKVPKLKSVEIPYLFYTGQY